MILPDNCNGVSIGAFGTSFAWFSPKPKSVDAIEKTLLSSL
jgi:hypothetical protein